ncbi:carbonic anhydrase [bacterium]|mgnify:CR=1 FL=1|jgi:carbonic anhydrase|nr:carbonic anhydrase [bacterium]
MTNTNASSYQHLLRNNKTWVDSKTNNDPTYFNDLSKGQSPEFLYIGCSDSRLPINMMTNTDPGHIFLHRNIANMVHQNDANLESVLEYAIHSLHVKTIIVAGHHKCGGVAAALGPKTEGVIEDWIRPIRSVYADNKKELDEHACTADRLSELNVIAQIKSLTQTRPFLKALSTKNAPNLVGWVLQLETGLIKDIPLPLDEWKKDEILPQTFVNTP